MPNDPSDMAVVLADVSARFNDEEGKRSLALENVTLSIRKGSFVSFLGASGAGKTTLMRVILGLMPHLRGEVVRNFSRPAMVFEGYALFPWLTALENVSFGLRMQGVPRKDQRRIAREKLHEVGLELFEHHYPSQLSGGQRQRVGLARALAIAPDLLVMDEPFSNLDTITADELKKDLLTIWRNYGMTVLMINHLIPDAVELSDEVVVLGAHPGHIEQVLSVDLTRPRDTRGHQFFREVDELVGVIRSLK